MQLEQTGDKLYVKIVSMPRGRAKQHRQLVGEGKKMQMRRGNIYLINIFISRRQITRVCTGCGVEGEVPPVQRVHSERRGCTAYLCIVARCQCHYQ